MSGHRPPFLPGGGAGVGGYYCQPPSSRPPPLNPNSNNAPSDPNFYLHNLVNTLSQNLLLQQHSPNSYFPNQSPNFQIQNPNFPIQNFYFPFQNSNFSLPQQQQGHQNRNFQIQNHNLPPRNLVHQQNSQNLLREEHCSSQHPQGRYQNSKHDLAQQQQKQQLFVQISKNAQNGSGQQLQQEQKQQLLVQPLKNVQNGSSQQQQQKQKEHLLVQPSKNAQKGSAQQQQQEQKQQLPVQTSKSTQNGSAQQQQQEQKQQLPVQTSKNAQNGSAQQHQQEQKQQLLVEPSKNAQNGSAQQQWQQQKQQLIFEASKKKGKSHQKKRKIKRQELVERLDLAVKKAWRGLIASGECVLAWKVSQAALVELQIESWGALGFPMQEVPSLYQLILTEGKINAFIHCFVAVRRITTLYDLEVAICENEGIEHFEELELGPLLQHPLVLHYFSMNCATEILKITTKEIVMSLNAYKGFCKERNINVDEFLDFIAKRQHVSGKGSLGVRIQSLGLHLRFIQEAKKSENTTLRKCLSSIKAAKRSRVRRHKYPHLSKEKKYLNGCLSAVSPCIHSFTSVQNDFRGKHIRFVSSSSEDEENNASIHEDKMTCDEVRSHSTSTVNCTDQASTRPFPSAAEEMSRPGLKGEIGSQFTLKLRKRKSRSAPWIRLHSRGGRKRNFEELQYTASAPSEFLEGEKGKQKICPSKHGKMTGEASSIPERNFSLSNNALATFVTTWKDICKEYSVTEVLEKMVQFYKSMDVGRLRRIKSTLFIYPCIGLLNVAVLAMKSGTLDSIYNSFQSVTLHGLPSTYSGHESIDMEPTEKCDPVVSDCSMQQTNSVTVEEILEKITRYYELAHILQSNDKLHMEGKFISLKKLCTCEFWLNDQYGTKEFKLLGHGGFLFFLEKHASWLPTELQRLFAADECKKLPLGASMLQHQLIYLVSQASNILWEEETISKQMISSLLVKQFPLISFKIVENGSMDEFLQTVSEYKNNVISRCILFSATLLGERIIGQALQEDHTLETAATINKEQNMTALESVTSQSAIEVLLRAPMLTDLNSWSHWELIFAPSLGPLVGWLLSEVNAKELLCLVTKDGKVIRLDQSANAELFLEAALQRSSFQTAVKILSMLALAGGEKHVPLSLLKCYAHRAFDFIFKNDFEDINVNDSKTNFLHGEKLFNRNSNHLGGTLHKDLIRINDGVCSASRFVIDCLGYLPSEFRGFAADILLSGMLSVIKDAPSVILSVCNRKERIMLHEIGLSIGIVEWIDDYHMFRASGSTDSCISPESTLEASSPVLKTSSRSMLKIVDKFSSGNGGDEGTITNLAEEGHHEARIETSPVIQYTLASSDATDIGCEEESCEGERDAALVIESIRRDEFGLAPDVSSMESTILKKQHARLGRALHCLSQELYSEDSHFLLELVQNADDNVYPEGVEPTLAFILQESGITILNNEQGFLAENIRALCDVGNSTKKGNGTGYIGQKGIGFKSVFRVTDAPEIHSNGFHIKFDITEDQIGFVLPTVVPACSVDLFSRLIYGETGQEDKMHWNTCIVLPFRSKLSEETAMKMFYDLHPSLLLFVNRLQCVMIRNMLNDSLLVMRKEILQDGIVKVSCGKDNMTWLVVSQKLQAHSSRPKVQTTEIALAFTLEESDNRDYYPRLDQQPVFSFLPLRTYGLKFILQGDFVLPSSREEVDKNDAWNEWLLTKFPGLFVSAESSFCALSCFRDNPGKAVAAFMSFVPLVGEVRGFFSGLPKAIALELRRTSCLILEGDNCKMVPPWNVLRGWNEQACHLLPDSLLQEHLGLGFLDKNIVLSDSLARALGIVEYGPEVLIKFMTCLARTKTGLKSMGLVWLSSLLDTLYTMLSHSSGSTDLIDSLRQIPFVPLADGTCSAPYEDTIWFNSGTLSAEFDAAPELVAFPQLCAKLRTVNPALFSASATDGTLGDNSARMLLKIGIQQLSAHEIVKVHVLPGISNVKIHNQDKGLMTDYLCFVMIHLQSGCPHCCVDRKYIVSELRNKAFILTNFGFKRPAETPIHFSKEFGNPIDVDKLIGVVGMKWHEVDVTYLKHPVNDSLSNRLMKWRVFFQEIGITDFVQVTRAEKSVSDVLHIVSKDVSQDTEMLLSRSVAKDWESCELAKIVSVLSMTGNTECCEYLLEILDTLWDDCFSDKATGYFNLKSNAEIQTFKSSFLSSIHDVKCVPSTMDYELHFSKDLFHDCDAVRSILGCSAPYACPKVKSSNFLTDIGFKTKVTLDDALVILRVWSESEMPFRASIAQMSKLYTFIWNEMVNSKKRISEALHSLPFIFAPFKSELRRDDLVSGVFLSSQEVYWGDPTGSVDCIMKFHAHCGSTDLPQQPSSKTLCGIYTGLRDFFVKECGVNEIPPCLGYFDILKQLSTVSLPSQTASLVLQIFLKWADELKSGFLSSEDIMHMKECLLKVEYTVLPTVQDKWVSLHPSFGHICWCDNKNLKKIYKDMENIDFLYFGNLSDPEEDNIQTKVPELMRNLGIPALSEIITREAIYYGPTNSSFKALLIDWALPYAQRYIFKAHPEKYLQLKQFGFSNLKQLKVTVVEKLFYRNVVKSCGSASKKRYECSCLLQDNTLYATSESDSHAVFLELSRLFLDGASDLHLANFLHMITTMVESGSTEDQLEFFISNSQNVPKLPDSESAWSLSSTFLTENDGLLRGVVSLATNESRSLKSKRKLETSSNWQPSDLKTAPGFPYAHTSSLEAQAAVSQPKSAGHRVENDSLDIITQADASVPIEIDASCTVEENTGITMSSDLENLDNASDHCLYVDNSSNSVVFKGFETNTSRIHKKMKLDNGAGIAAQSLLTGRLGEHVAFKYLTEQFGENVVKWVNEGSETGLPYDIVIEDEGNMQYVEVKATKSTWKNWFKISTREWQFAVEKAESYSIAHVVLSGNNTATVTIYHNPLKQCQAGKLHLVLMKNACFTSVKY